MQEDVNPWDILWDHLQVNKEYYERKQEAAYIVVHPLIYQQIRLFKSYCMVRRLCNIKNLRNNGRGK